MEVISAFVEEIKRNLKHGSIVSNGHSTQFYQVENTHLFSLFTLNDLNLAQPFKIHGGWVKRRTPKRPMIISAIIDRNVFVFKNNNFSFEEKEKKEVDSL